MWKTFLNCSWMLKCAAHDLAVAARLLPRESFDDFQLNAQQSQVAVQCEFAKMMW